MNPAAPDAEKAVISTVLATDGKALMEVDFLRGDMFADPVNQEVFSMARGIWEGGGKPEKTVLAEAIRGQGSFPPSLLDEYVVPVDGSLVDLGRIVEGKWRSREIIRITTEAAEAAQTGLPEDVLDGLERQIVELRPDTQQGLKRVSGGDFFAALSSEEPRGVPSGIKEIDAYLGGLGKGRLVTLASRPGVGKTTLALNIAASVAAYKSRVAFFSLEMEYAELLERLLARESHVSGNRIRNGQGLTLDDYDVIRTASDAVSEWPLYIDDTASMSVYEISNRAKKMRIDGGLDLIVIDYIQLMMAKDGDSREQEVAAITRALKLLARELEVPVLALSQLSRAAEVRGGKPLQSDLRESGAIENDSDQILMLWQRDKQEANDDRPVYIDVTIAKNRHGPVGEFRLEFVPGQSRFRSL